jgi:TonB-linked SusC/RagA family outer membrane protein
MNLPRRSVGFIMKISFVCITLIVGSQQSLRGKDFYQELDRLVTIGAENETLSSLLQKLKTQTELSFVFPSDYSGITFEKETRTVREVLDLALRGTNLAYTLKGGTVIIYEKPKEEIKKKIDGEAEVIDANDENDGSVGNISGIVREASSQGPLPGVNVTVKNTTSGTTTDGEGKFLIDAGDDDVLVFSFIGFKSYETRAAGRTVIDVVLEEEASMLIEVVVNAGYYNVKEKEKTGSISKVTSEVIGKQPVTNPLGALIGRMPGVSIQQTTGVPGGDFKIEIRGRNSLRPDGNDPLYIIDGVPFSSEKISGIDNTVGILGGGVNPLTSLNSFDIESVEVLKDADATAIYGSRGANGVVLITTKKGKIGKTKVDVNFYSGIGKAQRQKLLTSQEYLQIRREAFANDGLTPSADPSDDGSLEKNYRAYAPDLMVWSTTRYTDWQRYFIGGNANTTSLQTSISGGTEGTQFLASAGYFKQTSVFPGNQGYQKLSSHLSLNHRSADDKLKLNVSVSGTSDENDQPQNDFSFEARAGLAPNAPKLFNDDGTLNWEPHPVTGQSTWRNPMTEFERKYEGKVRNLVTNTTIGYTFFDALEIKTSVGLNRIESSEISILPSTWYDPSLGYGSERSVVNTSTGSTYSWIIEPQLNWTKEISHGKLSFLLGTTYQEQRHDLIGDNYFNFPSNALLHNVTAATYHNVNQNIHSIYKYAALYGRLNYNWKGKYLFNVTGRRDGSSRFGPGKQFANFGAIGAAWIVSEEPFIKEAISFLSFAKLRGSYGTTGSDKIGDYRFLDTYVISSGTTPQYNGVTGLDPSRLFNPDFAWESNRKIEGAIELGFLQDRILLSVAYYRNRSSNQLVNYTLPKTTGFGGILANLDATVQNTGVETELSIDNIQSGSFKWSTSLNVSVPRNKLIAFPNLDSSSYVNTYIIGKSVYIQKFYEYTGVNPETGLYTFKDVNADGVLSSPADNKMTLFIGQVFFGGISNSFSYKNWTLDIFFQVVKQTGIVTFITPGVLSSNLWSGILKKDRWKSPGDHADIQRYVTEYNAKATGASGTSERYNYSDASVTDASFIRCKNVSLSYQFPSRVLKGMNIRAYVQGQNLFVITNYQGSDPETQATNLPPLRTITAGINVTL